MTRRIAVISAGLSNPSSTRMLADRLASVTVSELAARGVEATVDIIELRDLAHDITDNLLTGFAPPALESAITRVTSADGLIAVTPIFSTSYSGLFKSFFDVVDPDALTGVPVLIGANAGTARHSLAIDYAIRPLFTYLHAEPVPTGVFAASSDWGSASDDVKPLASRIERGARELAEAMANRDARQIVDPFSPEAFLGEGKSFGHLLGGLAGE
ncbi:MULTISPECIES: FMN reductase [unclassified Salinibacterium]|uniref:FMN reductase n=1 Tax=unclassified Salinibacterium TaxID=2632331 RepID=UPI00141F2E4B|nr:MULTISPECIES: FMN reductase [unclassified Salinibacterium]